MKILGSGKVDDFSKIAFNERVLGAMDVKPGDSVIFYKKKGDNGISMFKAEGSNLTSECDSPQRLHLREAPVRLRMHIFGAILFMLLSVVVAAVSFSDLKLLNFILIVVFALLGVAGMLLSVDVSRRMDSPADGQAFVTVGGMYSKNRLTGISKLSSDGYVVSGDLFVNSLFSTNPSTVDVVFRFDNGSEVIGLCRCIKSVPGYCVYRLRMKADALDSGSMAVTVRYDYDGKYIETVSHFTVGLSEGSRDVTLSEGAVESRLVFDEKLNSKVFDEALFDPQDESL